MRTSRLVLLLLLIWVGVTFVGCSEGSSPATSDVAARVGDAIITKANVDRILRAKITSRGKDPDGWSPPGYAGCVAARRAGMPAGVGDLKAACKSEYDFERAEAILQLLYAEWADREAARREIRLSEGQVEKLYGRQKRREPELAAHDDLLIRGGATQRDLQRRVRLNELLARLQRDTPVSDAEIKAYFRQAPKEEFFVPQRRRLRIVLTRTRAAAARARAALLDGGTWFDVSRRYSAGAGAIIGDATVPIMKGSFSHRGVTSDKRFLAAAFRAPAQRVVGPAAGSLGWYVFTVDQVTPAVPARLERFADHIRRMLASRKLDQELQRRYGPETSCAKEYRTPAAPLCDVDRRLE